MDEKRILHNLTGVLYVFVLEGFGRCKRRSFGKQADLKYFSQVGSKENAGAGETVVRLFKI
ncbi:hypothetical protein XI25_15935 [Paenibacillus sp. DMB20]|nr:hypothetical protein XI25_15935 [Paenibacillus sp. DMB20]